MKITSAVVAVVGMALMFAYFLGYTVIWTPSEYAVVEYRTSPRRTVSSSLSYDITLYEDSRGVRRIDRTWYVSGGKVDRVESVYPVRPSFGVFDLCALQNVDCADASSDRVSRLFLQYHYGMQ